MPSPNDYLRLADSCFLKLLEEPCVYNIATDELYETNQEAFDFLRQCDGSHRISQLKFEQDFFDWCLKEGIINTVPKRSKRTFVTEPVPAPSLRYLELQLTSRCNLICKHCYLGEAKPLDLPLKTSLHILKEFEKMQGLRLLLSGGEPLLYKDFWTLNNTLSEYGLHSVLLTNGTRINRTTARKLKVHEVQVSLDGIGASHDSLRGKGSYDRALRAITELRSLDKDVSVATMVHRGNIKDFPALSELVKKMGIKEWNIDVPCATGRLAEHKELQVDYSVAAPLLNYSFGGGLYASSGNFACGAHLCTIFPDGKVAKCGFFGNEPVGHIDEGLRKCWEQINHIHLEQLDCHCDYIEECRGGCRYRALLAGGRFSCDPVQCILHGVTLK